MGREKNGALNAFVGPGSRFAGELSFTDVLRVDGQVMGSVVSESGLLIVGEDAEIDAEVRVARVVVAGTVKGSIHASVRVEVQKTGRVTADIASPVVTMENGAVFCGNCSMGENRGSQEHEETSKSKPENPENQAADG